MKRFGSLFFLFIFITSCSLVDTTRRSLLGEDDPKKKKKRKSHKNYVSMQQYDDLLRKYEALRSKTYNHLCELEGKADDPFSWVDRMRHHTLDVSNEESLDFVKSMIDQIMPLFRTKKFNICADETFDLGKGKNKET